MKITKRRRRDAFSNVWLRRREIGEKPKLGSQDRFMKGLYTSMLPFTSWDHSGEGLHGSIPGGIFNLEFSPDGSLLVAACEKKSVLMFDPLSRRMINTIDNAHNDCVNCIRFLDSRVFATGSDDSTVALWDARHLKTRIKLLAGHSNWVKNIEYSQKDGLLVTSGFDGKVYTWDINSDEGSIFTEVFHTNGLMRTRLTPDASKMIICTTGGYLMVIHDLDLNTLSKDIAGFKPNVYRLMQISRSSIPVATSFTHLLSNTRTSNRIEFIADFPDGDEAEVVSSLQVHPQGWCALSRNISADESTEWTCVHDIQDIDPRRLQTGSESSTSEDGVRRPPLQIPLLVQARDQFRLAELGLEPSREPEPQRPRRRANRRRSHSSSTSSASTATRDPYFRGFRSVARVAPFSSNDVWEALIAIREVRSQRDRETAEAERRQNGLEISLNPDTETRMRIVRMSSGITETRRLNDVRRQLSNNAVPDSDNGDSPFGEDDSDEELSLNEDDAETTVTSLIIRQPQRDFTGNASIESDDDEPNIIQERRNDYEAMLMSGRRLVISSSNNDDELFDDLQPMLTSSGKMQRIQQNVPRLTHYIEEPNVGKGFIKELCFTDDGRLISSPFGYGVRLLSFSPDCSELSTCVPKDEAVKLYEVGTTVCHRDIVVSTKFSPKHCLLVSGCLNGRICWHQPVL